MPEQIVEALVEGGKATAGPPLGPALGPLGVPIPQVLSEINSKTQEMKGMQVPIKVIIDTKTKKFTVEVGTPPTSALLKKELGLQKASQKPGVDYSGNLTIDQVKKVANIKFDQLMGKDLKQKIREVVGTCTSMGLTIENKKPSEFLKEMDEGKITIN